MTTRSLTVLVLAIIGLAACKKEEPVTPTPTPTTGTVRLSVEFTKGTQPFDFNSAHTDGAGNTIRFTTLKFYISGAVAKDDGAVTVGSFPSTYMLVDAAQSSMNTITLGTMAPGHIHELHFTLGLDSATNRADPTVAQYPLNIPGMHWSWNPSAGYKFMNMEGYVDTNGNGTFEDGVDVVFQYHCAQNVSQAASNPVLREGHVHHHGNLAAGATVTIEAMLDVEVLLAGIDLSATPVAMGNGAGNQLLMDNLATSIDGH
jgi:hypothetical protein